MLNATETNVLEATKGMLIGGVRRVGSDGAYAIINPATEEVLEAAPEASLRDVEDAVAAARAALPAWATTTAQVRAALLRRIATGIRTRSEELAPLITAETGCLLATATVLVERSAQRFERFAELLLTLQPISLVPELRESAAGRSLVIGEVARRPHGVVACIAPFNFPLIGAASKIAPALAMGNTVVYKPAPQDPLQLLVLASICEEVGVPSGVINIVTGSRAETGQALVASPGVDMVSFTGSTGAGTEIYRSGADSMRRALLELGGKGALIVRKDADLDRAVEALARVWTYYSGQWCAAPTRAIVHRDVHDEVVERLARLGASLKVGDPSDSKTEMGPVISAAQRDRIERMIAQAVDEGAEEVIRASPRGGRDVGYFVAPALLTGCRPDMSIVQDEVFGPVLSVLPFDDDDEAVELANGTRFGLTNYLYSRDVARAWELAARLRSGTVLVNTFMPHDGMPFGGVGMSGIGRDGGVFALESYSEAQGVALEY